MPDNISTTSGKIRDSLLNLNIEKSISENHYTDSNANIGNYSISLSKTVESLHRISDSNIDKYSYNAINKNIDDYESYKNVDSKTNNTYSNSTNYISYVSKLNNGSELTNSISNALLDGDTIGFKLGKFENGSPINTSSYGVVDLTDIKDLISSSVITGKDTQLGVNNRECLSLTFANRASLSLIKKAAIIKDMAEDSSENIVNNILNISSDEEDEGKPLGLSNRLTISDNMIDNMFDELTNGIGIDWKSNKAKLDINSTIFHDELKDKNINSKERYESNFESFVKENKSILRSISIDNSVNLLNKNSSKGLRNIITNSLKRNKYNVYSNDDDKSNGYLSNFDDLANDLTIPSFPETELWNTEDDFFGVNKNKETLLNKMKMLFSTGSTIETFVSENRKVKKTERETNSYDSIDYYGKEFTNNIEDSELSTSKQLTKAGLRNFSNTSSFSVIDGVKKPKIAQLSTDIVKTGDSGTGEFDKMSTTQKYMFSIENLAWKGFKDADSSVKFGPNQGRIMWFPPYGINFTDNVSASWNSDQFIGRGEPIYTYVNTERSGTLNFTLIVDYPSFLDYIPKDLDNKVITDYFKGKSQIFLNDKIKSGGEFEEENEFLDKNGIKTEIYKKLKCFSPAFHSSSPESFNERLTFLHQCTRQGPTYGNGGQDQKTATNLAFGRPPVCVLRLGDFYNQKIIIDNINITYEPLLWDMNKEGIGMQPQLANVSMSFKLIGGGDLTGPIRELQNAISFNFFANTSLYNKSAITNSEKKVSSNTVSNAINNEKEENNQAEDTRDSYNNNILKNTFLA